MYQDLTICAHIASVQSPFDLKMLNDNVVYAILHMMVKKLKI